MVHSYLPKWCTVICRNGAFPVAEFGALLFADHTYERETAFNVNDGSPKVLVGIESKVNT